LGLLVYGYTTGVFSSRKLERATYDSVAFRFIAANDHPDHDTIGRRWRSTRKIAAPLKSTSGWGSWKYPVPISDDGMWVAMLSTGTGAVRGFARSPRSPILDASHPLAKII
jgi:hypothetical protein